MLITRLWQTVYYSVGATLVALLGVLFSVALLYASVDSLRAEIESDLKDVQKTSKIIWDELMELEGRFNAARVRIARDGYGPPPKYGYGYTKLKCCCASENGNLEHQHHRNLQLSYKCPAGYRGPPGPPGPVGERGLDGRPGFAGEDYPSIQRSRPENVGIPSKFESLPLPMTCEPCPSGPSGYPGIKGATGLRGAKGQRGNGGSHGVPGLPGRVGETGEAGKRGNPGPPGPKGVAGTDGTQGAKGPTGLKGALGSVGVPGPRGVSGSTGSYGPPGNIGPPGAQGLKGQTGQNGIPGLQGIQGPPGNDALYCSCPPKSRNIFSSRTATYYSGATPYQSTLKALPSPYQIPTTKTEPTGTTALYQTREEYTGATAVPAFTYFMRSGDDYVKQPKRSNGISKEKVARIFEFPTWATSPTTEAAVTPAYPTPTYGLDEDDDWANAPFTLRKKIRS